MKLEKGRDFIRSPHCHSFFNIDVFCLFINDIVIPLMGKSYFRISFKNALELFRDYPTNEL